MKVSIIIPTYNEESNIARTLAGIPNASGVEVIISDGGSSDKTVDICLEHGARVIGSDKGRGNQLISGASYASGDVFLFLHADSILEPDTLDKIRKCVESGAKWGCCTLRFDDSAFEYRICAFMSNLRSRVQSICYGDQGIFCERSFYEESGGFSGIPIMEDLEFSIRARRKNRARVINSHITTSARRFRKIGFWRMVLLMQKMKMLYFLGAPMERLVETYRRG